MTISTLSDVEFGEELPTFQPDTSLANVKKFTKAAGWVYPVLLITRQPESKAYQVRWFPAS